MGDVIISEELITTIDNELSPEQNLLNFSLNALSAISSSQEEYRKFIMDSGCHKLIIEFLRHSEPKIRSSACLCIISLGRADKSIKEGLITEGAPNVLNKLLYDKYLDVQVNAVSALCNVTLDFQKQIRENSDCVKRLVELTQSKYPTLRYKAIFALKNLVFMQSFETKKSVMDCLTYPRLLELLDDSEMLVQEQAICILRTLLHKRNENIQEVIYIKIIYFHRL